MAQVCAACAGTPDVHPGPVLTCLAGAWWLRQTSGNEASDPPALPAAAWLTEVLGDRQPGFSPPAHGPLPSTCALSAPPSGTPFQGQS